MTDKAQHTPGPWRIEDNDSEFCGDYDVWISGPEETIIAACWAEDAPIIAAAPELLEALKLVEEHYGEDSDVFCTVRAAIAKAEGRV